MAQAPKVNGYVSRFMKNLKSKEFRDYLMSTHFLGPAFNWSIPLAGLNDIRKHPKIISGRMTLAMMLYSSVFMRFAWVVNPRNLLLFACHCANFSVQSTQGLRYLHYNLLPREKQ